MTRSERGVLPRAPLTRHCDNQSKITQSQLNNYLISKLTYKIRLRSMNGRHKQFTFLFVYLSVGRNESCHMDRCVSVRHHTGRFDSRVYCGKT